MATQKHSAVSGASDPFARISIVSAPPVRAGGPRVRTLPRALVRVRFPPPGEERVSFGSGVETCLCVSGGT